MDTPANLQRHMLSKMNFNRISLVGVAFYISLLAPLAADGESAGPSVSLGQDLTALLRFAKEPPLKSFRPSLKHSEARYRLICDFQTEGVLIITFNVDDSKADLRWKHVSMGLNPPNAFFLTPRKVDREGTRRLSSEQTRTLRALLAHALFFKRPPRIKGRQVFADGTGVLIEGIQAGKHRIIDRSNVIVEEPEEDPLKLYNANELNIVGAIFYMVGLSGVDVPWY